jgi:hypothetical protein
MYNNDFQNWAPKSHLVVGRPEEKVYNMKFTGQSSFAKD